MLDEHNRELYTRPAAMFRLDGFHRFSHFCETIKHEPWLKIVAILVVNVLCNFFFCVSDIKNVDTKKVRLRSDSRFIMIMRAELIVSLAIRSHNTIELA